MTGDKPQFLQVGEGPARRRIAYLKAPGGAGPGLVWLSGLKSDMASTKASMLAQWAGKTHRPMLRFDFSGHGLSEGDFADGTIGRWLEETLAVLAAAAAGPQVLIGSSMGGWMALLVLRALRRTPIPGIAVAAAVLIAPAWDMTETLMWDVFPSAARQAIEREGVYHRPSEYGEPYPITRNLIEEGRAHLLKDRAFDPGCPVHILHGMRDPDVPWRHSLPLVELLTGDDVRLTLVKDGEHRLSRPQDLALLIGAVEALCA